jgi:hypothetical protein
MSDLAPFLVAAAVRDQVVTDLQEEVSQLHEEKRQLQQLAMHYKSLYERNHPFRNVSLVLLPATTTTTAQTALFPTSDNNNSSADADLALARGPSTLASCRVNLDHALSSGMVQVFEGHADAAIPVQDLDRVELRIGDSTTACRLVDLTARSVMYFQCITSSHFFVRFLMEQGPDLMLDAGIGPLTHKEYCDFFRVQMTDLNPAASCDDDGGLIECNMLDVRDRVSRPIDLRRLVSHFSPATPPGAPTTAATTATATGPSHDQKFVKFMFDEDRMSSDFLFEYLDTPYDPTGMGGDVVADDEEGGNEHDPMMD